MEFQLMEKAQELVDSGKFKNLSEALQHLASSQKGGGGSQWRASHYALEQYIPANVHHACMNKNIDNTPMFKPLDEQTNLPEPTGLVPTGLYFAEGGAKQSKKLNYSRFVSQYAKEHGMEFREAQRSPIVKKAWEEYKKSVGMSRSPRKTPRSPRSPRSTQQARSLQEIQQEEEILEQLQSKMSPREFNKLKSIQRQRSIEASQTPTATPFTESSIQEFISNVSKPSSIQRTLTAKTPIIIDEGRSKILQRIKQQQQQQIITETPATLTQDLLDELNVISNALDKLQRDNDSYVHSEYLSNTVESVRPLIERLYQEKQQLADKLFTIINTINQIKTMDSDIKKQLDEVNTIKDDSTKLTRLQNIRKLVEDLQGYQNSYKEALDKLKEQFKTMTNLQEFIERLTLKKSDFESEPKQSIPAIVYSENEKILNALYELQNKYDDLNKNIDTQHQAIEKLKVTISGLTDEQKDALKSIMGQSLTIYQGDLANYKKTIDQEVVRMSKFQDLLNNLDDVFQKQLQSMTLTDKIYGRCVANITNITLSVDDISKLINLVKESSLKDISPDKINEQICTLVELPKDLPTLEKIDKQISEVQSKVPAEKQTPVVTTSRSPQRTIQSSLQAFLGSKF